jgi:hypothetical protein
MGRPIPLETLKFVLETWCTLNEIGHATHGDPIKKEKTIEQIVWEQNPMESNQQTRWDKLIKSYY